MEDDGYVAVADYGLATELGGEKLRRTLAGTPGYMAPEAIRKVNAGYDMGADRWAIGILMFELLTGINPFEGASQDDTDWYIENMDIKERLDMMEEDEIFISVEAQRFIIAILNKDKDQRLGHGDKENESLKAHKWFEGFNWDALAKKELKAPFKPEVSQDPFDLTHFKEYEKDKAKMTNLNKSQMQKV